MIKDNSDIKPNNIPLHIIRVRVHNIITNLLDKLERQQNCKKHFWGNKCFKCNECMDNCCNFCGNIICCCCKHKRIQAETNQKYIEPNLNLHAQITSKSIELQTMDSPIPKALGIFIFFFVYKIYTTILTIYLQLHFIMIYIKDICD